MFFKKLALSSVAFASLAAAVPAHAAIIFDNSPRQDFTSNRGAGSSPLAVVSVASATAINQIGAFVDLAANGNLKFLIYNADTGSLLFNSGPTAFVDNGLGFKLSNIFADFVLNPGINYGIGAVADVAGLWGTNNSSSGNPFTQNGITASDDRNLNVAAYTNPSLGSDGAAMIIIQLGAGATTAVPESATWLMMIAGFGIMGASLRYRRRKIAVSFG